MRGEKKEKNRSLRRLFFLIIAALFLVFFAIASLVIVHQRLFIARLEDRVRFLKEETIPLRFMVLSRGRDDVSARFRFYDTDGNEVAAFERSWKGSELAIDSVVVPIGDRSLVFPSRVFTDTVPPRRGTDLFGYYDRDGMPAIFDSKSLDSGTRAALGDLFARVRASERGASPAAKSSDPLENPFAPAKQLLKGSFGNAVHDIRLFRSFEVGAIYALLAHSDGGVEIIQE